MPPAADKIPTGTLQLQARCVLKAAEGDKKERRFEIVAYTGEPLQQGYLGWDAPIVVDMAGIDAGNGTLPILDNHGPPPFSPVSGRAYVVGQSETAKVENGEFVLRGKMLEVTAAAKEILALADAGFSWQASIGANCLQKDFIAEGNTVEVNGRTYEGPVYVSRKTVIREVSFVVIGADRHTSVVVASSEPIMAKKMSFAEYCKNKYDMEEKDMSAKLKAKVKAEYEDEDDDDEDDKNKKDAKAKAAKAAADAAAANRIPTAAPVTAGDVLAQYREEVAAEQRRIAGIRAAMAAHPGLTIDQGGKPVDLCAHAIAAGWSAEGADFQLALIRASRVGQAADGSGGPQVPNTFYFPQKPALSDAVLEAAVLQAGRGQASFRLGDDDFWYEKQETPGGQRVRRIEARVQNDVQRDIRARYTDQVQQHAHDLYKGRISLHQLLTAAAYQNGYRGREVIDDGNLETVLRACFPLSIRAEGSTVSLQNALANILNKYLLAGYLFGEQTYRQMCATRPTKDFKPTKSINVFGDFVFQKVNADGQLQNAAMTDEAFANQVDTFGRILNLTRQIIINDDLNALTTAPMLMGIGSLDRVNSTFWTIWLNMTATTISWDGTHAFWYTGYNTSASTLGGGAIQANRISGGTTALSSASLQTAWQTYDKQVKPNGQPLGAEGEILLVPPELWVTGWELTDPAAAGLVYGGASAAKQANINIWRGRLKLLKSRYLSNSTYTNNSATAWWLLANPQFIPAIEIAFLNGQEQPTVQTAQADFNTLGIMIRGFFDFGVAAQNPRAGVMSNGA
jgi:hypothetical protein